jgi:hypothetical protein
MFAFSFLRVKFNSRSIAVVLICVSLIGSVGCNVKNKVSVPTLLGPLNEANAEQLIAEVNRLAQVQSMRGKVDVQFEDTSFSQLGLAEKYKTADGTVIVQRPAKINLKIQVPVIGTNVAVMTSDGEHFRVAVLQGDEKYRRFLRGTNNAEYKKLSADSNHKNPNANEQKKLEQQTVNVLSNVRPQHFTDAILLSPIKPRSETGFFYSQSEIFQDELANAKSKARVMRGYYLLDELAQQTDGSLRVARRFWFDRVGGIRLARVQDYDEKGVLIAEIVYGPQTNFGEDRNMRLPLKIEVTRFKEKYKLSFTFQSPEAVALNQEYPATAFLLENSWGLPEVDLDKPTQ